MWHYQYELVIQMNSHTVDEQWQGHQTVLRFVVAAGTYLFYLFILFYCFTDAHGVTKMMGYKEDKTV